MGSWLNLSDSMSENDGNATDERIGECTMDHRITQKHVISIQRVPVHVLEWSLNQFGLGQSGALVCQTRSQPVSMRSKREQVQRLCVRHRRASVLDCSALIVSTRLARRQLTNRTYSDEIECISEGEKLIVARAGTNGMDQRRTGWYTRLRHVAARVFTHS